MHQPGIPEAHPNREALVAVLDKCPCAALADLEMLGYILSSHKSHQGMVSALCERILSYLAQMVFNTGAIDAPFSVGKHRIECMSDVPVDYVIHISTHNDCGNNHNRDKPALCYNAGMVPTIDR